LDVARAKALGLVIKPVLKPILAGIKWLNALPGRKRGLAAILLGFGTSLRVLGLDHEGQAVEGFNTILQGLSTSSDIAGAGMGFWALIHPLIESHEQKQTQTVNMLEKLQEKTPDDHVETKALQAEAIDAVKSAKVESAAKEAEK